MWTWIIGGFITLFVIILVFQTTLHVIGENEYWDKEDGWPIFVVFGLAALLWPITILLAILTGIGFVMYLGADRLARQIAKKFKKDEA